MPAGEDRIKYDHLFSAGDPENKAFWAEAVPTAGDFENRFVSPVRFAGSFRRFVSVED